MFIGSIGSGTREFRDCFNVAVWFVCVRAAGNLVRVREQTFFIAHEVVAGGLEGAAVAALEWNGCAND